MKNDDKWDTELGYLSAFWLSFVPVSRASKNVGIKAELLKFWVNSDSLFMVKQFSFLRWGTVDAKIKACFSEKPELSKGLSLKIGVRILNKYNSNTPLRSKVSVFSKRGLC